MPPATRGARKRNAGARTPLSPEKKAKSENGSDHDGKSDKSSKASPKKARGNDGKDTMFGIRFTHPEKIMFPKTDTTKAQLAQYYLEMEERMMPYVKGRPLTLVRGVKGVKDDRQWVQKHPPRGMAKHMKTISVKQKTSGDYDEYMVAESAMALVSACQMDALEFHTWHSERARVVLDLDPANDVPFAKVKNIAEEIRAILDDCKLKSFVMLTGSIGLHIMTPIKPGWDFDKVREFARAVVQLLEKKHPDLVTANPRLESRKGKIFVDYIRNSYNQTTVAPYSTRAQAGAPVACPVGWDELSSIDSPKQFNIKTVKARLKKPDPWKQSFKLQQEVPDNYAEILEIFERKHAS